MHPAHRLIQMALRSLGYDPQGVDGWWGGHTQSAAEALLAGGPAKSSPWAVMTLQRGLDDLGYTPGVIDGHYGPATRKALGAAVLASGLAAASFAATPDILAPVKPTLSPVPHDNRLMHGATVIRNFMLHTTATPGNWWRGKTNRQTDYANQIGANMNWMAGAMMSVLLTVLVAVLSGAAALMLVLSKMVVTLLVGIPPVMITLTLFRITQDYFMVK